MRRVVFMLLCAAALAVAGCGGSEGTQVDKAETEGVTVDLGGLKYQVQISRFLNPNDVEDAYYLRGLPETTDLDPGKDAVWFAIFMRVKNESGETRTPPPQFMFSEPRGKKFQPVPIAEKKSPFVYLP